MTDCFFILPPFYQKKTRLPLWASYINLFEYINISNTFCKPSLTLRKFERYKNHSRAYFETERVSRSNRSLCIHLAQYKRASSFSKQPLQLLCLSQNHCTDSQLPVFLQTVKQAVAKVL
jgi:hypothetical protein